MNYISYKYSGTFLKESNRKLIEILKDRDRGTSGFIERKNFECKDVFKSRLFNLRD